MFSVIHKGSSNRKRVNWKLLAYALNEIAGMLSCRDKEVVKENIEVYLERSRIHIKGRQMTSSYKGLLGSSLESYFI